ncbi:RBBP9/YdeN family alpha/beta hydrolase [Chitinivibrio alkaliphilus]|uniref:Putative esterase n=1 Tax=Chitinivibrio alkaliphilus ACht1 TaxID=1313304 RepID=U7D311_9BACT|nr:alpha/beta fold hydrolase [Chitinivibrio alkaliphilus]ERP30874.1 putative esterase [Chitinivibrio alkaliphilus ACht1]
MTILTLPGLGGSPPTHWQSLWEKKHGYRRIEQNPWDHVSFPHWAEKTVHTLSTLHDTPIVLIAHSMGTHVAARIASDPDLSVGGLFLVAPPDLTSPLLRGKISGFSTRVRPLSIPVEVHISTDDPYSSVETARAFAASLGGSTVFHRNGGHLNADSGIGFWSEGHACFKNF